MGLANMIRVTNESFYYKLEIKMKDGLIKHQEWTLVADSGGTITRMGNDFANRLERLGIYVDAKIVLAESKVGDVIKTGVSAYQRTK